MIKVKYGKAIFYFYCGIGDRKALLFHPPTQSFKQKI